MAALCYGDTVWVLVESGSEVVGCSEVGQEGLIDEWTVGGAEVCLCGGAEGAEGGDVLGSYGVEACLTAWRALGFRTSCSP